MTVAGLLSAAALLWVSSRLDWLQTVYATPLRGRVVQHVTGESWQPVLVPLAVLAVAGVAGALATAGPARRLVGGLLVAAGVWVVVLAVRATAVGPAELVGSPGAPSGGRPVAVDAVPGGPVLAGLAGLALLGAGALVVLRGAAMPRLGARYAAPGPRSRRQADPDRRLWDALDAGLDPTAPGVEEDRGPT